MPASMVTHNLLLAIAFNATGADPSFSFPSPWSLLTNVNNSGNLNISIWAAICTGSSMAGPDVTWSGNTSAGVWIGQYENNLSTLAEATGATNSATGANSGNPTSATNPGLTTTAGDSLVVSFVLGASNGAGAGAPGTPTSYNSELATTFDNLEVSDYPVVTSGNSSPSISEVLNSNNSGLGTPWITAQIEVCSEVAVVTIIADPVVTTLRPPTQTLEAFVATVAATISTKLKTITQDFAATETNIPGSAAITINLKTITQDFAAVETNIPGAPTQRIGSRRIFIMT